MVFVSFRLDQQRKGTRPTSSIHMQEQDAAVNGALSWPWRSPNKGNYNPRLSYTFSSPISCVEKSKRSLGTLTFCHILGRKKKAQLYVKGIKILGAGVRKIVVIFPQKGTYGKWEVRLQLICFASCCSLPWLVIAEGFNLADTHPKICNSSQYPYCSHLRNKQQFPWTWNNCKLTYGSQAQQ